MFIVLREVVNNCSGSKEYFLSIYDVGSFVDIIFFDFIKRVL